MIILRGRNMTVTVSAGQEDQRAVLVVYTGGTFGMSDRGNGLESRNNLESTLMGLLEVNDLTERPPWRYLMSERIIDSADANFEHALSLAATIRQGADGVQGVVVVHGTDTLAYTAAVASFLLTDLRMPVIFTGSQRALGENESDAPRNFRDAYRLASTSKPGVYIAFGGAVLPAVRAVKRATADTVAFSAESPLAPEATGIGEQESRLVNLTGSPHSLSTHRLPSVGLLRVFPGLHPELIRAASRLYPDGIVLECYGAGTAPISTPGMFEALADATASGAPVIAVTQCAMGTVHLSRYALGSALEQTGVWSGHDLTADAALAKISVLSLLELAPEQRHALFNKNLVGEQRTARAHSLA